MSQCYGEAFEYFSHFYHLSRLSVFVFFAETNDVTFYWIARLTYFYTGKNSERIFMEEVGNVSEPLALLSPNVRRAWDDKLLQVLSVGYTHPPQSLSRITLRTYCIGVEIIQAELCLLNAWDEMLSWQLAEIKAVSVDNALTWCRAGLKYLKFMKTFIKSYDTTSHKQSYLAHLIVLVQVLLTAAIAMSVRRQIGNEDVDADDVDEIDSIESAMTQVAAALNECHAIGVEQELPGVLFITSHYRAREEYVVMNIKSNPLQCVRHLSTRWSKCFS
jgi:hypothetical protein